MSHHLVGAAEVAAILGVTRQRVAQLATSPVDFPEPVVELSAGRVWLREAVEGWAATHPNRGSRRPSVEYSGPGARPERVVRVLSLASEQAAALGHGWVGVHHILLALLHPACPGKAREVLESFGLRLESVRDQIVKSFGDPFDNAPSSGVIPPGTQLLLERASRKAVELADGDVDSEHVLLALTDEWERRGLTQFLGIDPQSVCERVLRATEETAGSEDVSAIRAGEALLLAPSPAGHDPRRRLPWGSRFLRDDEGRAVKVGSSILQHSVDRDGHPVWTTDGRLVQHVVTDHGVVLRPIDVPAELEVVIPNRPGVEGD